MKILYICADGIELAGNTGGAIHMRSFIRALGEAGHTVSAVSSCASSLPALEADLHARVYAAPRAPWNHTLSHAIAAGNRVLGRPTRHNPDPVRVLHNFTFLKTASAVAQRLEPDFIYERYTLWSLAGLWLARVRAIPLVLEVNAPLAYEQKQYRAGLTCPPLARWVERSIWRRADLVLAVSEPLRRWLEKARVDSGRVRTLPNAVDTRLFHRDLDSQAIRRRLNLEGRFVVGFAGSFRSWHGVEFLVSAFRDFHGADPSTHLLLVGDGPLRPRIEKAIREAGLEQAVTFAGAVAHEKVPLYLAAMDAAVAPYPALEEFYYSPLKLFEYMAAGRAVVASRVGQVADVVEDGKTGLLFEPGDRQSLVQCLRRLKQDATLGSDLGKRAHAACSERTCASSW